MVCDSHAASLDIRFFTLFQLGQIINLINIDTHDQISKYTVGSVLYQPTTTPPKQHTLPDKIHLLLSCHCHHDFQAAAAI